MSNGVSPDPLRRLAQERGRMLGEMGVRPEDENWARAEAEALASLTSVRISPRLPERLARLLRRLARAARQA